MSPHESLIILVLCLLFAVGAATSPFNTFLRFKFFSDGYRWRGFNREDSIPLGKTLALSGALLAGAVYGGLAFLHKTGSLSNVLAGVFGSGIIGTAGFSIWYSLWRARRVGLSDRWNRWRDRLTSDLHFPSAMQESNGSKWYISGYCPWHIKKVHHRKAWYLNCDNLVGPLAGSPSSLRIFLRQPTR